MVDPAASVATLKQYIDVAAVLGTTYFHHTYGPILDGQSKSDYLGTAVRVAKETAYYAGKRGIGLLTEPQGATMNGVEMLSAYFDRMGYDGWFALEYDAPETFDLYYPASYENFKQMYVRAFKK